MTGNNRQAGDYNAYIVSHWLEKAQDDLDSALANFQAGRLSNAVRDIYFACFHVVSALFMKEGKTFRKHSQVRAGFHRDLIKSGRIDVSWGPFYEWVFDHRQQADYLPIVEFETDEVEAILTQAGSFVRELKQLIEGQ